MCTFIIVKHCKLYEEGAEREKSKERRQRTHLLLVGGGLPQELSIKPQFEAYVKARPEESELVGGPFYRGDDSMTKSPKLESGFIKTETEARVAETQ